MSSRVGLMKWIGALQLVHGLLLFILVIPYFAIDFDEYSYLTSTPAKANAKYAIHWLVTIPTILTVS